ncbi:KICSTOR complex protein ITFG2-like [Euwallacea fornicatus]|uniref:KICSTOR complex protein ITFG2-like n=1 Tax=Euwallacea fornicatus TaxID=995702 RepID=UPI00338E8AE5
MRAISLVNKLEFEFPGNVARSAVTLGDIDNDGHNELIIGNDQGDVAIFKGSKRLQTISELNFVACVAVGDIRNVIKNSLVIITSDGWCYIYEVLLDSPDISIEDEITVNEVDLKEASDEVDGQGQSSSNAATSTNTETHSSEESTFGEKNHSIRIDSVKELKNPLVCVHVQRIPANVKTIILGDVDGDGQIEMVLGLTDRVVRSYRFVKNPLATDMCELSQSSPEEKLSGKLVALNKWECANQIGSITLHHSPEGQPSILVAQPGGTFMRIKCQSEVNNDQEILNKSDSSSNLESFPGSVDYQFLGISRMRNQNISTEIIGDLLQSHREKSEVTGRPYAVATLDGTIMLVQDEVILWAIAVDHQIFALTKLDVTGDGSEDIVVCTWDGLTYILDQNKNSVRFHLEEPVRAFESGWYSLDVNQAPVTALVYVTFKNTVILYYDIPVRDLICKRFEPDLVKLSELFVDKENDREKALEQVKNLDKKTRRDLIEYLLYEAKS